MPRQCTAQKSFLPSWPLSYLGCSSNARQVPWRRPRGNGRRVCPWQKRLSLRQGFSAGCARLGVVMTRLQPFLSLHRAGRDLPWVRMFVSLARPRRGYMLAGLGFAERDHALSLPPRRRFSWQGRYHPNSPSSRDHFDARVEANRSSPGSAPSVPLISDPVDLVLGSALPSQAADVLLVPHHDIDLLLVLGQELGGIESRLFRAPNFNTHLHVPRLGFQLSPQQERCLAFLDLLWRY